LQAVSEEDAARHSRGEAASGAGRKGAREAQGLRADTDLADPIYGAHEARHETCLGMQINLLGRPDLFDAAGILNDVRQVKVAMTNASLFAYVADGKNGLRVVQLTSPETLSTYAGFSPRPQPQVIAFFRTKGEALAISKGLDRDRAVDESGNQISVFGRRGARPFTYEEMMRLLRTNDGRGEWFSVTDLPSTPPKQ